MKSSNILQKLQKFVKGNYKILFEKWKRFCHGTPDDSQTFKPESDAAVYFEEPRINAGKYQLEILVPSGLFLPSK